MSRLSSYINVFNTCLVLLQRDGFSLAYDKASDMWSTEKDGFSFLADNPIELLGLVAIYQKLQPKENEDYWWQINEPDVLAALDPELS
jgi:hypothetical protein